MRSRDKARVIKLMIQMVRAEGIALAIIKSKIAKIYERYGLI